MLVTRGYSNGTLVGSIAYAVTMGYDIGSEIPSQIIGNVTASFGDSGITVNYEDDVISVGYKPNAITVNFKT